MAAQPIASIFHNICSAENLMPQIIFHSPDRLSLGDIAAAARNVLNAHYQSRVEEFDEHYQSRLRNRRASNMLEEVARAATCDFGKRRASDTMCLGAGLAMPGGRSGNEVHALARFPSAHINRTSSRLRRSYSRPSVRTGHQS